MCDEKQFNGEMTESGTCACGDSECKCEPQLEPTDDVGASEQE